MRERGEGEEEAEKILDFLAWRSGWETWKLEDWWGTSLPHKCCELMFFCQDSERRNGEVLAGNGGDLLLPLLFSRDCSLGEVAEKLVSKRPRAAVAEGPLGCKDSSLHFGWTGPWGVRLAVVREDDSLESLALKSQLMSGCLSCHPSLVV